MASVNQVRGVLLEEAILMLLRASGYQPVTTAGSDIALVQEGQALYVLGRGGRHQIDAIADLRIGQAFCNPQRLLIEAKAYSKDRRVSLPVVRGAVGVLKDVSEFWIKNGSKEPVSSRHHYQFAIFSTSAFTEDSQDYAFAHDVHLLPLRGSTFFRPVVDAIEQAVEQIPDRRGPDVNVNLSEVRHSLRELLQFNTGESIEVDYPWLAGVVRATRELRVSLIAMLGMEIPVFLTPNRGLDLNRLDPKTRVQIHIGEGDPEPACSITRAGESEPIFTFDLPARLFERYATDGVLDRRAALNLKEQIFSQFTAIYSTNDTIRVFNFVLDQEWVTRVREGLGRRRHT